MRAGGGFIRAPVSAHLKVREVWRGSGRQGASAGAMAGSTPFMSAQLVIISRRSTGFFRKAIPAKTGVRAGVTVTVVAATGGWRPVCSISSH